MFFDLHNTMPELTTSRLTLRKMLPKDAKDMYEYACREDVTEYLLWSAHPNVGYTAKYLKYIQGEYKKERFFDWAIIWNENQKMIGTVGYTELDMQNKCAEIGYVLNPLYHNRGIATEAVSRVIRYAFCELGMQRVEARYMIQNSASLRVMEKCGMKAEGILRSKMLVKGIYRDIGICSILKEEYFKTSENKS